MGGLIKAEIRKILFRKSIIITWIFSLLLGSILIHTGSVSDIYADAFSKIYDYTPIMGLLMFMILSGAYTLEYNSNMRDLINTTQNGKKKLVIAKAIGAGIATSIVNITIVLTIYLDALKMTHFKGLSLPIKDLWSFKGTVSNLNVSQMMVMVIFSVIIGSFLFSQIGLYLSSISKSASVPFIFGGLIMGIPYVLGNFLPEKLVMMTPLRAMICSQLVKSNASLCVYIMHGVIFIVICSVLPKLTYNSFIKENLR